MISVEVNLIESSNQTSHLKAVQEQYERTTLWMITLAEVEIEMAGMINRLLV